jgi:hypothetical protein
MNRAMAASLDHYLTTAPEPPEIPLPGDEGYPRCGACGAFLRRDAIDRSEYKEYADRCDGQPDPGGMWGPACGKPRAHKAHPYTVWAWEEIHRTCRNHRLAWRCRHDNVEVLA